MLDKNQDGKIDLQDMKLVIEELDAFAERFIVHEWTNEAIDKVKEFILPLIELLDSIGDEGIDAIRDIRNDWQEFIDMLDDGESPLVIASKFKEVIDETRENVTEIADIINDASEQFHVAKGFLSYFMSEAPKAFTELKEDTAENSEEWADEMAEMKKLWAEGDKLGSIQVALTDGVMYAADQAYEFFDFLGDLAYAGVTSITKSQNDVYGDNHEDDKTTVVLVAEVDTSDVDG